MYYTFVQHTTIIEVNIIKFISTNVKLLFKQGTVLSIKYSCFRKNCLDIRVIIVSPHGIICGIHLYRIWKLLSNEIQNIFSITYCSHILPQAYGIHLTNLKKLYLIKYIQSNTSSA